MRKRRIGFFTRLSAVPHLFAKLTVVYCVLFASMASVFSLYMQAHDHESASLLAVILGFFGGELLLICLKTIFKKDGVSGADSDDRPDPPV